MLTKTHVTQNHECAAGMTLWLIILPVST